MTTSSFTQAGAPIGVYLPSVLPGTGATGSARWARRAVDHGIAVLALTTEGADDPAQPLEVATRVVRDAGPVTLLGDVGYGPDWLPGPAAEHTAVLDGLTGGRYVPALTVPDGPFDPDLLDVRLAALHRTRRDLAPEQPLRLLLGGAADRVAAAVARHGAGWFQRTGTPATFAAGLDRVHTAWSAARRPGRPRAVAAFQFALGELALTGAELLHARWADRYGPDDAAALIAGSATTEAQVGDRVEAFLAAGADLVLAVPAVPDVEQLDRLAAAALPRIPAARTAAATRWEAHR